MKKISILFFIVLVVLSCDKKHPTEYLTFSGKLENNKDSVLTISAGQETLKTIKINSDGTFKDTLKVEKGDVFLFGPSDQKKALIYLKNGFNLTVKGNADEFMKSFTYSGFGSDNTNFITAYQNEMGKKIGNPQLILELEKDLFEKKVASIKAAFDSIKNTYKSVDSVLIASTNQRVDQVYNYLKGSYQANKNTQKGSPSPKFVDYIDYKGGKKSFDFFKGKYVYLDIWATWCGPCIAQIPFLQEIEKEYHNKNIAFVSISTDESNRNGGSWEKAEQKWRDFVKKRQMSGVQLWSGKDFSFQQAYQITGIPRFILVDPNGNIVSPNAPRPSDPALKVLFTSLGI